MSYKKLRLKIWKQLLIAGCLVAAVLITYSQNKNPNGRNDAWSMVGSGGGGAMFYPTVSPHDPNTALVGCDMTGSYITYNGGASWRMFNLRDRVRFFVFDPLDANTVYANGLGLFKSTDKGNTWNILYPDNSLISGIVAKGDHAEEMLVTKDSSQREILALAIDPADSKKLYAAIEINKSTAIYTSGDGGLHWQKEKETEAGVKKIFIDPSSPKQSRTIYVAKKNGIGQRMNGEWKSYPAPETVTMLTEISGGYDAGLKKYILYSISGKSYFNPAGDLSGIYFSDNGGQSWQNRQDGMLAFQPKTAGAPEWRTIATSALHPAVVYVSYHGLKLQNDTTCMGVAKSEDYGKTWQLVWKDIETAGKSAATPNMKRDWMNERYGPDFGENPFSIGVAPSDPGLLYATDFGRTIKSENGGSTWQQAYSNNKSNAGWTSRGLDVTTGYCVVYDPFDSNHVFIAKTDIGLLESKDAMASWNSATQNNGVPHAWENTTYWLTFDPKIKGKAWAVMSGKHDLPRPKMFRKKGTAGFKGGILVTENSGKTWKPVSTGIGEAAMTHILLDPASPVEARVLYASAFGKGVYKSIDGGNTWQLKNKGITGAEPFAWQITRRERDGALFLIVSRRSEDGSIGNGKDGALYISTDGAENWSKILLPDGTNAPTSIAVDAQHGGRLILSAWGRTTAGRFTPDTGGGIFISGDEGKTWKSASVKDEHVSAITYDPRNGRLYACGFEGSAWYSQDGGDNWERIKGFNFKWTNKVGLDERDPEKIFIITFGGGVWHGPAKGDDQALEDIITPVK